MLFRYGNLLYHFLIFFLFVGIVKPNGVDPSDDDCNATDTVYNDGGEIPSDFYTDFKCSSAEVRLDFPKINAEREESHYFFVDSQYQMIDDPDCQNYTAFNATRNIKSFIFDPFSEKCSQGMTFDNTTDPATYQISYVVFASFVDQTTIVRKDYNYLHFTCEFDAKFISTRNPGFLPVLHEIQINKEFDQSNPIVIEQNIERYTDDTFSTKENSRISYDGEQIYLQTCFASSNYILQGDSCFISNVADVDDVSTVFPLIEAGCPVADPRSDGNTTVYSNFESNCLQFSFTAFHWTLPVDIDSQKLFVFCRIFICDQSTTSCDPPPSCDAPIGRKRREIEEYTKADSNLRKIVSFEPIKVEELPKPICDKKSLGCSFGCATASNGEERCFCPLGTFLAMDGKTCYSYSDIETNPLLSRYQLYQKLSDVAAVVVMLVSVASLMYSFVKK